MMRLILGLIIFAGALVIVAGCDDSATTGPAPSGSTAGGAKAGGKAGGAGKGAQSGGNADGTRILAVRGLELTDADFMEGPTNRDPFRSYIDDFGKRGSQALKVQAKVILQRYGLEELTLIALITGGTTARAMFRDPTGLGVVVRRGDFVSKSAARVKQILSDRIVMEMQEMSEGTSASAERVILINPARARLESGL